MTRILFLSLIFLLIPGIVLPSDNDYKKIFELSLEELMQVPITTSGKTEEKINDVPASVVIMTRNDIERLGFTTYTEILQHIPGLYKVDDRYWLGSVNYGVRGFFSTGPFNDMVILVNGVNQLSDKYSDYPDVKINVPLEAIDRIEVIRGPMSVLYGSGAFFGVINIITNDNHIMKPVSTASISYGSLNTQKFSARYASNDDNFKYSINISAYHTDGIDRPFSDLTDDYSVLEYVGLDSNSTTKDQMDDDRRYFNMYMNYKDFYADISYAESLKDIFDGQPGFGRGCEMTTHASNIAFGYKKEFSDFYTGHIKFGYYSHDHFLDYELFRPEYYEIDAQSTHSYDIDFISLFKPVDELEITFGLYRRTVLDILQISDYAYYGPELGHGEHGLPSGETYSTHSLYTQFNYNLFDGFNLIYGFRLEHLDAYNMTYTRGIITEEDTTAERTIIYGAYTPDNEGLTFTNRVAGIYKLNDDNVVKLLFGQATKQPSFSENYRQLPDERPQLEEATINTYELNYILSVSNVAFINMSLFHNQLNNLISNVNIYNPNTGEWILTSNNSGKMNTTGFELGVDYITDFGLRFNLSAVYTDSKNEKEGYEDISLCYSPKWLGYMNATYKVFDNTLFSVLGRYVDKMETCWVTESTPENGQRLGLASEDYFVFDANLRINNIIQPGVFLNIKVNNLFDREIRYPATKSNAWINKGLPDAGRTILCTAGYSF